MEKEHNRSYIKSLPSVKAVIKEINFATEMIINALRGNKRIVIKHHKDVDGLIGGYVIEKALRRFCIENQLKYNISRFFYSSPIYKYSESIKDWNSLEKDDMLILVDFGSSRDSLLGLKRVLHKGIKVVIIDHHPLEYKPEEIEYQNLTIINPHKYTQEVSVSAGIISIAIAENITFLKNKYFLGLISMFADKYYNEKHYEYMRDKINIKEEDIKKYTKVIDFEIFNSNSDYGIIDFVLNKKNEAFISKLYEELVKQEKKIIEKVKEHMLHKENVYIFPYDNILTSHYPPPGRLTGILFEEFKNPKGVLIIGIYQNNLIFRSNDSKRDFDYFKSKIEMMYGRDSVEGGGHKEAGSLRLITKEKISAERILNTLTGE